MNLGPHAAFIWMSYLIVAGVVGAMIAWLIHDGRRHADKLAELESQGIRRRSSGVGAKPSPGPTQGPAQGDGR